MLDAGGAATLCVSCRLNRVIPDLSVDENRVAWVRIEHAKRRLVSQLLALGLPVVSRVEGAGGEDVERGLAFDFLRPTPDTDDPGHAGGIVTLNIEEADDATRGASARSCASPIVRCSATCGTRSATTTGTV